MPNPTADVQKVLNAFTAQDDKWKRTGRQRLRKVTPNQWSACCPAHDDENPSLTLTLAEDGKLLVHCHSHDCKFPAIAEALGLEQGDFFPSGTKATGDTGTSDSFEGCTLEQLAEAKGFRVSYLKDLGLYELPNYNGVKAVAIPYRGADGDDPPVRFRVGMSGDRFRWRKGSRPTLYGLDRLRDVRDAGWVLLVEGESDCWTAWLHGLPVLGVPGKAVWKPEWNPLFTGLDVFLWQEPDAEDFAERVGGQLPGLRVVAAPDEYKDLNEAFLNGENLSALVERLRTSAVSMAEVFEQRRQESLAELREKAAPVLALGDPLPLVRQALKELGYGGDLKPALITYLAVTTRLLNVRSGTMLAHLLLMGQASSGKSYTAVVVFRLLPKDAVREIDAGSPRVLIYSTDDYKHRVLFYGEADSLPAGEDNPAASAVRNLLQENVLRYQVVVKDPVSGQMVVQKVEKEGPTTLITTSTKSLGPQLMTRLFTLNTPTGAEQIQSALLTQGTLEEDGAPDPNQALVDYQAYLQAQAGWDVVVPFAKRLSVGIFQQHTVVAQRILRDYQRLLSLVKAVAVLRHTQRGRNERGQLVATVEDYATVYDLTNDMYEESASEAAESVRKVVAAVDKLCKERGLDPRGDTFPTGEAGYPTAADVARELKVDERTARSHVGTAVGKGWLINQENQRGRPWRLRPGNPLPEREGLPTPKRLAELLREEGEGGFVPTVAAGTPVPPVSGPGTGVHTATESSHSPSPSPGPTAGETAGTGVQGATESTGIPSPSPLGRGVFGATGKAPTQTVDETPVERLDPEALTRRIAAQSTNGQHDEGGERG